MKKPDRIRLAEAIGYRIHEDGSAWPPNGGRWQPILEFDPFNDANDDYAVLQWCRSHEDAMCHVTLHTPMGAYLIGDFARAALKALDHA